MATNIEKIKERKAALILQLKDLEKKEDIAESDNKKAQRKEDNRTKLLMGILLVAILKEKKTAFSVLELTIQSDKLSAAERKFLKSSKLWNELRIPIPKQDLEKTKELAPMLPPLASQATPAAAPMATARPQTTPPATPVAPARPQAQATPITPPAPQSESTGMLGAIKKFVGRD